MFKKLLSRRGLSIERLKTLVEIGSMGNISKAANGDPVRASLQSRQLRELAEHFGCELTQRRGRNIQLTPEGKQLADLARHFLTQIIDFEASCQKSHAGYSIGAGDSLIQWLVIPRIAPIVDAMPEVRLSTLSMQTSDIVRWLNDSRLDFGLVRKSADMSGLRSLSLGHLSYRLVVPLALLAGNPAPTTAHIFARLPMAMQISEGEFTRLLAQLAQQLAPGFRPSLECQSLPQVLSAVKSRRFVAVLPGIAMDDLPARTFLVLSAPELRPIERDICLVWNPRVLKVRPHARKLLDACGENFKF